MRCLQTRPNPLQDHGDKHIRGQACEQKRTFFSIKISAKSFNKLRSALISVECRHILPRDGANAHPIQYPRESKMPTNLAFFEVEGTFDLLSVQHTHGFRHRVAATATDSLYELERAE